MKTFDKIFFILFASCLFSSCEEKTAELIDYSADKSLPSGLVSGEIGSNYGIVAMIDNNNVAESGGTDLLDKGVAYSLSSSFDLTDSSTKFISAGPGTGAFNATLTGLGALTTYYYRTVATNTKGIALGDIKSFKTISLDDVPRITGVLESEFVEDSWSVDVIAVPGIYYRVIDMYDFGFNVEVLIAANGNATVARQQITTNLYGYGAGYVDGTGKLDGKTLALSLRFTVSAGSFGTYTEAITFE